MAFCTNCGQPRTGASFCTRCGRRFPDRAPGGGVALAAPVGTGDPGSPARVGTGDPGSPAPGPVNSRAVLVSGWPAALVAAAGTIGIAAVASVLFGSVVAVVMTRGIGVLRDAVVVSLPLVFAAFGSRSGGWSSDAAEPLGFLLESPALPWMAVGFLAALVALRLSAGRLTPSRPVLVAHVLKAALVSGVLMAGLALALPRAAQSLGARAVVGPEAGVAAAGTVALAGLALLVRRNMFAELARPGAVRTTFLRAAGAGVGAFGLVLAAMTAVVVVAGKAAVSLLVVGASLGTLALVVSTGGKVEMDSGPLSLSAFSLPADPGAAAAPLPLLILLGLVPAIVAACAWRFLSANRPPDRRTALSSGAALAAGFVLSAGLALILARALRFAVVGAETVTRFDARIPLLPAGLLVLGWALGASLVPSLLCRVGASDPTPPSVDRGLDQPEATNERRRRWRPAGAAERSKRRKPLSADPAGRRRGLRRPRR